MEEGFSTYKGGLDTLNLDSLEKRRKVLTLRLAKTSLADGLLRDLFPLRSQEHVMKTRKSEKYLVTHAHTERFRKSPIITMQRMLNQE